MKAGRLDVEKFEQEMYEDGEYGLQGWWAYYKLEPWDLSRVEELIAKQTMNTMKGSANEKDLYPFLHADFEEVREQHEEEIEAIQRVIQNSEARMAEIRARIDAERAAKKGGT